MDQVNPPSDPELLAAARDLLVASYWEEAKPLLHQIIDLERSSAWSEAHVELSVHHFCLGEYELSTEHAGEVLRGRQELVSDRARAIAGVMFCNARDLVDQDFDDELLLRSAEACLNVQEQQYAAIGFEILGHRKASMDRQGARLLLERAVHLYDETGSMRGGPSVLVRLARLSLEEGKLDEACAYRDRALAHLARFLPGYVGRLLEQQLQKLQDAITKAASTS